MVNPIVENKISGLYDFIRRFAGFVADNAARFDRLLAESRQICGEWINWEMSYNYGDRN